MPSENGGVNLFRAFIMSVFDTHVIVKLMRHVKDTTWKFPDIDDLESVAICDIIKVFAEPLLAGRGLSNFKFFE